MSTLETSETVTVLVPTGALGAGVRQDELEYGIASGAQVIASDAGSTDSGAAYLALGKAKYNRGAVKRDLKLIIEAAWLKRLPVLIGTSGQAGGDENLEWTRDIALEIARELKIQPRIALLYSEVQKERLKEYNRAGQVRPLAPLGPLTDETIDACDHIVAALGVEPFIAALEGGADIILGGRTTDTAVLAAYPLWKGAGWGASWHAGKVGECGAVCTVREGPGAGVLLRVGGDSFTIEPLSTTNRCTTRSVSGHMLYENGNPFLLTEPGGILDVTEAAYEQLDDRSVKVTGSVWRPQPYTLKLEGAAARQFQTIMLVGIQDPIVLADLPTFHDRMLDTLNERVHQTMGDDAGDFSISLRIYGWNAVSGEELSKDTPPPREVGVLFVATAETQEIATQIAKACNPYFFHLQMPGHEEMPSYAFPFSPAYIPRGPVYEFLLNHVVQLDDPSELVRTEWIDVALQREVA